MKWIKRETKRGGTKRNGTKWPGFGRVLTLKLLIFAFNLATAIFSFKTGSWLRYVVTAQCNFIVCQAHLEWPVIFAYR